MSPAAQSSCLRADSMAVRFDAATDQLSSGSAPASTTAVTVTAWVRNREGVGNGTFLRLRATATIYAFTASGGGTNGPQIATTGGTAGPFVPSVGNALPIGEWRFVAMTINGTGGGNGTVYHDIDTGGALSSTSGTVATGVPTALSVGGRGGGDTTERWGGDIAHQRIWTAVLTPTEIAAERDSSVHVRASDLWAAWELPNASTLTDTSGNGRHLTAGETAVTTQDGPLIQSGTGGVLSGTLPPPLADVLADIRVAGELAGRAPFLTAAVTASTVAQGTLTSLLPMPSAALVVSGSSPGLFAGFVPMAGASIPGDVLSLGQIVASPPTPEASVIVGVSATALLSATLSAPISGLSAVAPVSGALAGALPVPLAALTSVPQSVYRRPLHAGPVTVGRALLRAGTAVVRRGFRAGTPRHSL
jgi:hypothetical protein